MKKKMFALSGIFLIVLVIAGLWTTKATNLYNVRQARESAPTPLASRPSIQEMAEGSISILFSHSALIGGRDSKWD
jgi:hypothetical protein